MFLVICQSLVFLRGKDVTKVKKLELENHCFACFAKIKLFRSTL